jgi:phenylpyruvate tautomerase PptA (4-oxalocrotonate tautomerase family)
MPLVRIDLIEGRGEEDIAAIGEAVQRALVETLGVPERDRFQVITEHARGRLVYDSSYLGVPRTDDFVLVQVTLSRGRTTEQKQAFYARLAELLARNARMRPEDLAVSIVESTREDWSFGNGVAQYLVLPREEWK